MLHKPECLAAAPSAPKLVAVKRKTSSKSGRRWAEIVHDAFVGALERYGLQAVHSVESSYRVDGGSAGVRSLLSRRPFPTALLCGYDLVAIDNIRQA